MEGTGRGGSPFCPLGAPFQAGAVVALYRRGIRSVPSVREVRTVRLSFMGGVTVLIGSVRWWAAVYKCPVISLPSLLPPSTFVLASASSPFLTHAPSSGSEVAFLPPENACETHHRR